MISVLCGNVYAGFDHVELLLRNMAAQYFRDFELILADSYYTENKDAVTELSARLGLEVVHAPSCYATNAGRKMQWELYSNALLLSSGDWVLHHGVFRYLHRTGMSIVAKNAANGLPTVFAQINVPETAAMLLKSAPDVIESGYAMRPDGIRWDVLSQSGFFCVNRETLVEEFNGHNEALVLHHWVDVDLNTRFERLRPYPSMTYGGALLRTHKPGYDQMRVGKPICTLQANPDCVAHLHDHGRPVPASMKIDHNGYLWSHCAVCGAVGVENPDDYMSYVRRNPRSPINVAGIGRNISRLDADVRGLSLQSRVEIISASHTNPRYLEG